ncbi:hyccin isoform X1 [Uranotaenia lowii]|uniref:hyccin isoform X1 n=1 Tax=Uranotaenia lowii TaxID=190385 RepID=UPI00247A3237|nr:hyccin isoform X1 [Uranotaenia lowii]
MAEAIISDWIADYNSLQESEVRTFAAQHENDFEISKALYTVLNERTKYKDLIYPVCNQLCNFYRSNEVELRRFTLQFVPLLIYLYLTSVALGDKKGCRSIETLLICIYNIEVSADDGSPKVVSFRMPVLAQASIYHEEKSLLASDLRRWEENSKKEISWGPLPSIESINAQNRLKVMTALLFTYNQQLNQIHKPALYHLCKTTSQLVNQGFSKLGHVHRSSYGNDPVSSPPHSGTSSPSQSAISAAAQSSLLSRPVPRIAVSSQFLVELAHANYFAMFNEFASAAIEAVNDIHSRACYEMLSEVILVTNAIRNSLHANPSGQPSDGPMGISVALTPATTTVTVSKSMITNASFRAKKLPDDIPIQGPKEENGQLSSINEENETGTGESVAKSGTGPGSKAKDSKTHKVLGGLMKLKDKDKEKEKEKEKEKDDGSGKQSGTKKSATVTGTGGASGVATGIKEKLVGKQSLQMQTGSAELIEAEKTSPLLMVKRKSSSIDVVPSAADMIGVKPVIPLSNGGVMLGGGGDDKGLGSLDGIERNGGSNTLQHPVLEVVESFDSGNEMTLNNNNNNNSINNPDKSLLENRTHGSIQVSQV